MFFFIITNSNTICKMQMMKIERKIESTALTCRKARNLVPSNTFGGKVSFLSNPVHHSENTAPASGDRTTMITENMNDSTDIKVARCSDGNISCRIVFVRT